MNETRIDQTQDLHTIDHPDAMTHDAAPHDAHQSLGTIGTTAQFVIGQVVKHRFFPFRGVIFDVDPIFNNTEDWWLSIPEDKRPSKEQPFYHIFAENEQTSYIAYVSQQNLLPDDSPDPLNHPALKDVFGAYTNGIYLPRRENVH